MKRIGELAGNQRLAVLSGRTLKENYEWWLDRERRGANGGHGTRNGPGPNYVPPAPRPDDLPPETKDPQEGLQAHLRRVDVPDHARALLVRGLRPTEAVGAIQGWFDRGKPLALLYGESGSGKTVAACIPFLQLRRTLRWGDGQADDWDSVAGAFWSAVDLARAPLYGKEADALHAHLERVTLLVIDDLGVEPSTEGWHSMLTDLVGQREARERTRTILTTNLSCRRQRSSPDAPSPFEARYGGRIARRIRESGAIIAVGSGGGSGS